MSDVNSSNTQAAPAPTPVPPAGPSLEEMQARLAELEKQSEGRLRDLQEERRKRQELEARIAPASAPSAATIPDVMQDELGKVLNPYIAPVAKKVQEVEQFTNQYYQDKAMDYLSSKIGKSREDILADTKLQERMLATARKWGVGGNVYDSTVRVYELMQLEDLRQKEVERARASQAANNASMPSGAPPAPATAQREFSKSEFDKMPLAQFDELSQKGTFKKTDEGKFVYIPHSA